MRFTERGVGYILALRGFRNQKPEPAARASHRPVLQHRQPLWRMAHPMPHNLRVAAHGPTALVSVGGATRCCMSRPGSAPAHRTTEGIEDQGPGLH